MILFLRAIFFYSTMIIWFIFWGMMIIPLWWAPVKTVRAFCVFWLRAVLFWARIFLNITYKLNENWPKKWSSTPCIIASSHQSLWETVFFAVHVPYAVFILKEELLKVPILGWYLRRLSMIAVQRGHMTSQRRHLFLTQAQKVVQNGHNLIIFPHGTRIHPNQRSQLHSGVAVLAAKLKIDILPVSLNSGVFWPVGTFVKYPGVITIKPSKWISHALPLSEIMLHVKNGIEKL